MRFSGVFGFDESLQVCQAGAPECAVLLQPGIDRLQRFGVELIDPVPAFAALAYQMSAAQQAQVFGNGGPGYRKCAGNLAGGLASLAQQIENGAAGGIGQGVKCGFRRICNRTVTHTA